MFDNCSLLSLVVLYAENIDAGQSLRNLEFSKARAIT